VRTEKSSCLVHWGLRLLLSEKNRTPTPYHQQTPSGEKKGKREVSEIELKKHRGERKRTGEKGVLVYKSKGKL